MKKLIFLVLAASLVVPTAASAATATVKFGVNFRTAPSTDARVVGMLTRGQQVEIVGQPNSYWYKVKTASGSVGYISTSSKYTSVSGGSSGSANATIARSVNFRSSPKVANNKIGTVPRGANVRIVEQVNSWWVKIVYNGVTGYVDTSFLSSSGGSNSGSESGSAVSGTAASIIADARNLIGKVRYEFGTRNVSRLIFDCSSFTEYVFEKNGVSLKWGTSYQKNAGYGVSKSNLKAGDLVFFDTNGGGINHVGIYISDGEFIHNSPSGNVNISSLSSGYWSKKYVSARRVL
ncbi:C40 family peptidase [Paenibacillus sp. IB182496]|uniref:C40 family peptidase n=1 Tax=Paenibacillus sabuli TaxID=2772509 RepID=A0A927BYP0_9BACL|nr:SH3 domain-containing C40 family peptidase [Paenibacillus sabuli]MBD2847924.1 C40 family peptidase [Paenibacillus sabuli]